MSDVKHRYPRSTGPRVERIASGEYQALGIEALSPIFFTRAEAEAWLRVALEKGPKAKRRQLRSCLCCGKGFESDGFHNRLCSTCRGRSGEDIGQRPYIERRAR